MSDKSLSPETAKHIYEVVCETICRIEDAGKDAPTELVEHLPRLIGVADALQAAYGLGAVG
jgi:hypothetical protein